MDECRTPQVKFSHLPNKIIASTFEHSLTHTHTFMRHVHQNSLIAFTHHTHIIRFAIFPFYPIHLASPNKDVSNESSLTELLLLYCFVVVANKSDMCSSPQICVAVLIVVCFCVEILKIILRLEQWSIYPGDSMHKTSSRDMGIERVLYFTAIHAANVPIWRVNIEKLVFFLIFLLAIINGCWSNCC